MRAMLIIGAALLTAAATALTHGAEPDLLYVLQPDAVAFNDLVAAEADWLVLEPSRFGDAASEFTALEVQQIRTGGPCQKKILAYLSIGEAESYRDYWNPAWVNGAGNPIPGVAPAWLGPQNPDFGGNYKVRYWDPDWQALMWGTPSGPDRTPLDRILDAGFDGVYLDIVDAYYFWSTSDDGGIPELPRMTARALMIDMVEDLANYARVTRGVSDFLVFPQNAQDIIRDDEYELDAETARYFGAISGIGNEDLYYNELNPQPAGETAYVLEQLVEYRAAGKTILVTDYVIRPANPGAGANNARVAAFYGACRAEGFVPYAAHRNRDLNEIVTFNGPGWTYPQPTPGCPEGTMDVPGDADGDGDVDFDDLNLVLGQWGGAGPAGDVDEDGDVDFDDLNEVLGHWGA